MVKAGEEEREAERDYRESRESGGEVPICHGSNIAVVRGKGNKWCKGPQNSEIFLLMSYRVLLATALDKKYILNFSYTNNSYLNIQILLSNVKLNITKISFKEKNSFKKPL